MSPNSNIFPHREYLTFLFKCWSQHCSGAKYTLEHMLFRSSADWRLLEGKKIQTMILMTPYINMRQSHAPGPCHSLQSALSYPFSVISPLPLWKAQTAAHTVIIPPTLSLLLSLLPPHWGFLLWLLFVRTKTKPTARRMFNSDRKWEDTDLSSLSLSLYLALTHTHIQKHTHLQLCINYFREHYINL